MKTQWKTGSRRGKIRKKGARMQEVVCGVITDKCAPLASANSLSRSRNTQCKQHPGTEYQVPGTRNQRPRTSMTQLKWNEWTDVLISNAFCCRLNRTLCNNNWATAAANTLHTTTPFPAIPESSVPFPLKPPISWGQHKADSMRFDGHQLGSALKDYSSKCNYLTGRPVHLDK